MSILNNALIMAAGKGHRLLPHTSSIPKALIEVNGTKLIDFSFKQIHGKIKNIYLTVGYKAEHIKNAFNPYIYSESFIDTLGKGNSWWIFNSKLKYINEPVLVLPCDIITHIDIDFLLDNYKNLTSPSCLLIPTVPNPLIAGDFIFGKNGDVDFISRNLNSQIYCSGIQIINPFKINLNCSPCENFHDIWDQLIKKNELKYSPLYPYQWYSINNNEQLSSYDYFYKEVI